MEEKPHFSASLESNVTNTIIAKKRRHIPQDIVRQILLKLPLETVPRYKFVCPSWRALILDPRFIKSHRYGFIFNSTTSVYFTSFNGEVSNIKQVPLDFLSQTTSVSNIEIMGSCNGMLLVVTGQGSFLWNPTTKVSKKIIPGINDWGKVRISGVGYDPSRNIYKFVIAVHRTCPNGLIKVRAFAPNFGSLGWDNIVWLDDDDKEFDYRICNRSVAITVNDNPHWVVNYSRKGLGKYSDNLAIVYFDVQEDKFKKVPQPDTLESNAVFHIGDLGGSICIADNHQKSHVDIWKMKEYGVQTSWTKLFTIRQSVGCLRPLGFKKNGDEIVMVIDNEKLVTYNLKMESKGFKTVMLIANHFQVAAYLESLVPPEESYRE